MQENEGGWKTIMVETVCDFARIITPNKPSWWSKPGEIYSMGLRLTDAQVANLRSKGAKCVPKEHPFNHHIIYNFIRPTMSAKGNKIPELEVVRWDKKVFKELVGDGSKVIVVLEYADYPAGERDGQRYSAGVTFRLGAVQIIEHVEPVEYERSEEDKLSNKFKEMPAPVGYVEKPATPAEKFKQVAPPQQNPSNAQNFKDKYADAKEGTGGETYDYVPEDMGGYTGNEMI